MPSFTPGPAERSCLSATPGIGYISAPEQPASTKAFKNWALSGHYELEVAGRRVAVTPHWEPLYDPAAMRMRDEGDVCSRLHEPRLRVSVS